jgi:hypothetical protein
MLSDRSDYVVRRAACDGARSHSCAVARATLPLLVMHALLCVIYMCDMTSLESMQGCIGTNGSACTQIATRMGVVQGTAANKAGQMQAHTVQRTHGTLRASLVATQVWS